MFVTTSFRLKQEKMDSRLFYQLCSYHYHCKITLVYPCTIRIHINIVTVHNYFV